MGIMLHNQGMSKERNTRPYEVDLDTVATSLTLSYRLGTPDMERWENPDLLGGNVTVRVNLRPQGERFLLTMDAEGSVRTVCDRCLDMLELHIDETYHAVLYPSDTPEAYSEPDPAELDAESPDIIPFDRQTRVMDLEPLLADTIVLGLPLRKVHEEGLCNTSMERVLSSHISSPTATLGSAMADDLRSALRQSQNNNQNNTEK